MAALLGQIILQAAERALVYVGTALAGLVIGEKIVDATKEAEDEFESKDTTACLVCGPSNTANTNPDKVGSSSTETVNNGPAGTSDTGGQESVENDSIMVTPNNGPTGTTVYNSEEVKDILDGLPGKTGKTGPIKEVSDKKELDDLFDSLSKGSKTVDPGTYPGVVKELPDGTIIRQRPGSKSGGATLDITMPDGKINKVHIK